jgi:hypothetical protein
MLKAMLCGAEAVISGWTVRPLGTHRERVPMTSERPLGLVSGES